MKITKLNGKTWINILLIFLVLALLCIQYISKNKNTYEKDKYFNEMFLASKKMKDLSSEIKRERLNRGIPINKNVDIYQTGLIGLEWSELSTTLGDEVAKRTSTNPDFAALLVKKIKSLNLKKGDVVAVNMSSSFPALNLALISVLDTLELESIIINTVGSSSYGANIREFNYLDMENHLYNKNLIKNRTIAYSLGGIDDIGKEFDEELIDEIKQKNERYNLKFFFNSNLEENIEERYLFYNADKKIKLFINIGGNILAFGRGYDNVDNSDLILEKNLKINSGLIGKFYNAGVPVIHLLNIKGIALKNNIPVDISSESNLGESKIFFNTDKDYINFIIVFIVIIFIICNKIFFKQFKEI